MMVPGGKVTSVSHVTRICALHAPPHRATFAMQPSGSWTATMTRIKSIAAVESVRIPSHCRVPLILPLEMGSGNQRSVLLKTVPQRVSCRERPLKRLLSTGAAVFAADDELATPRNFLELREGK